MEPQVISALLDPAAYPEPTHQVQLVQTHVSYLFITDYYVYKIKKAVDFGFLSFTDLDRRHFFCGEEVRLNRRLCPGIYLGVVAVRQTANGFHLGNSGEVVDYAVKMIRLPAERMLNHLLDKGEATTDQISAVAQKIAEFHLTAETSPEIAQYGLPAAISANWAENFQQLTAFVPVLLPTKELQQLREWVALFMAKQANLLNERVATGFIRDGDGDIHSENICLADQIWIFDCIEFNQRFRYGDTAADLAFLLMDLDFHGRPDLAAVALATYTAITGDRGCRALLPFYKLYRAVIRAKVEALHSADLQCSALERHQASERARAYFRLARGLLVRDQLPPTLFMLCGLMGSGKTTLARALAFELGLPVVRSDELRKELSGIPPQSGKADAFAAGIYTESMTERTYATLEEHARKHLAAGSSVIVDASFAAAGRREQFMTLAESLQVRHCILYLCGDDALHLHRLQTRSIAVNDASDGRPELFGQQKQHFSPPTPAEFVLSLDAAKPPDLLVADVYHALNLAGW